MSTQSKLFTVGARSNVFHVDPKAVVLVGLDTAHKAGEHVLFDDRALEQIERPFIEGIKAIGVLEPVLVRKSGGNMEVVFGRKRTLALRIANAELIAEGKEPHKLPILPERKGTSDLELLQKLILENEARRETSPMQKALRLQDWFARKSATGTEGTDSEAAVVFCTTATTIRNWKKLLALDAKVQSAILQGKISANAAADLSDLEPKKQVEKLRELQGQVGEGKQISTAQTEGERKTRKGSIAATAYAAPSISKIRKIAENAEAIEKLSHVQVSVASLLKFISGLSDGSDIPGLKAMIDATPARGNAVASVEVVAQA